jgi:lauroyl/myristoyl acyltransferase
MSSTAALAAQTSKPVELIRASYYSLFQLIMTGLGRSPFVAYRVGSLLGMLRYRIGYIGRNRSRRVYLELLQQALPQLSEIERRKVLLAFWVNHQKVLLELFLINRHPSLYLGERVSFRNLEVFDQALSLGRGVILTTPHFGNERVIHLALGFRGYEVAVVTSRFEGANPRVVEAKIGAALTWNKVRFPDQNVRWLYEYLSAGGVVQLSPTAPGGVRDPVMTFLNHRVRISGVPVRLGLKTGAVVLPVYDYRMPDDHHQVVFDRPFDPGLTSTETGQPDWAERSIGLMSLMEQKVLQDPGQFYWMWLVIRSQEWRRCQDNPTSR